MLAVALGDADLAEEATQEAFARAYRNWQRVAIMDSPSGWVYVVAANHARRWWRRSRPTLLTSVAASPAENEVEDGMVIDRLLDRLTVRQRKAVVLRYLADLSYREVAAAMRCTESTARVTVLAAVALLTAGVMLAVSREGVSRVRFVEQPQQDPPAERRQPAADTRPSPAVGNATSGFLPNGTRFTVRGPEAAELEPTGSLFDVMVQLPGRQEAVYLGIVTSTKWREDPPAYQPAHWEDRELVVHIPPYSFHIDVYGFVFKETTRQERERIAAAMTVTLKSCYPVVRLDPPLRFSGSSDGATASFNVHLDNGLIVIGDCPQGGNRVPRVHK